MVFLCFILKIVNITSVAEKVRHKCDLLVRKVARKFFQIKMKITGNPRPDGYPYITGDSFRAVADHVYDNQSCCDPLRVKRGDIVFVGQEFLCEYFEKIHPDIRAVYILVCHNGDGSVDETIADRLDDKIGHFFAQNTAVEHEKITPIPIGMEDLLYYVNGPTFLFRRLQKKTLQLPPVRKNKIFFSFSIETNPAQREPAKNYFLRHPQMETVARFLTPFRHAKTLTTYKFVASPPGNGIDCIRTWEALYLRTIPVVKDSVAMRYFKSLKLPIWIVRDWRELDGLAEKEMATIYDKIITEASWEPLHMDFWIKKIKLAQISLRTP